LSDGALRDHSERINNLQEVEDQSELFGNAERRSSMLSTLIKKEFLGHLLTFRFAVAMILCEALILASTYILVRDYEVRLKNHDEAAAQHEQGMKYIKVFSQVRATVDRRPHPLSILAAGSERDLGSSVFVRHLQVPVSAYGKGGSSNPLLSVFSSVDLAMIVRVLLSLLVLLLSYDAISGERERDTLAQTLANSVSRAHVLLGKYLGGMAGVTVALLIALLSAVLVAGLSQSVSFSASEYVRIGGILLASLLYLSALFLVGMLISARAGRSSTSLILLFFLWIVFVVLIPNASAYLSKHIRPVPSDAEVSAETEELERGIWEEMGAYKRQHPRPRWWDWRLLVDCWRWTGGTPYARYLGYGPREAVEWYLPGTLYAVELQLEYADKIWAVHRRHQNELLAQRGVAQTIARLSPAWLYGNVCSILAGTDVGNYLRFMDATRKYRLDLLNFMHEEDGFSLRYFTRLKMEDVKPVAELKGILEEEGEGAIRKLALRMDDFPPILGIPRFTYAEETMRKSFVRLSFDLLMLILLNLVLFAGAYLAFVKARVR